MGELSVEEQERVKQMLAQGMSLDDILNHFTGRLFIIIPAENPAKYMLKNPRKVH